jgi:NADPH:quinone reductase-like Zn-dependent oxidoreductase
VRGYVLDHYGDASAMTLREVPVPAAGAGLVLIRVHAAGLNPIDYKVRQGKMRQRPPRVVVTRSSAVWAPTTSSTTPG